MSSQLRTAVRWQRTAWQTIVLALLWMMASGLVTAQMPKVAAVRIKDGRIGTTSRGNEISFKVKNYQVVGFTIPIDHSCPSIVVLGESVENKVSGSYEVPDAARLNIKIFRATGSFQIQRLKVVAPIAPEVKVTFTVQGRFHTDGSASGTLQIASTLCEHPVKLNWKATVATASEPQQNAKRPPATAPQAGKIEEKSSEQKVGPDKRYEQCVRAVVDRLLASKTHQVLGYAFGRLSTGGFGGYVSTTGGSTLYVDESTKQGAVSAFVSALAMAIPGFAMQRFELQGELGACEYESK